MKKIIAGVVAATLFSSASFAFAADRGLNYNQYHRHANNGLKQTIDIVDKTEATMVIKQISETVGKPNYINSSQMR